MTVVRDGKTLKTIPISAGSAQTPTYNGQMVISEKFVQTRMNGSTVGFGGEYDIPDVPHAMRLTTSGTFIHGNYWYNRGNPPFGKQGTSHGCVGLADARGAQGEEPFSRLLPVAVRGWLREVAARAEAPADPNLTRLALATVRGLLLDLVGTQDRKAVDAAADTFVRLLRCADHIP